MKRIIKDTLWDLSHPAQAARASASRVARSIAIIAIALAIVLTLVGGGIATWNSLRRETDLREQVVRTQTILSALREVQSAALDAETGQRGFLITRERSYLDSYHAGVEMMPAALAKVHKVLNRLATPFQMDQLKLLEDLIDRKFKELADTIDMVIKGRRDKAVARVDTEAGKKLMDEIRAVIRSLILQEEKILSDALAHTKKAEHKTIVSTSVLGAAMVAVLFVAIWLFVRAIRLEEAQREMEVTQAKLDQAKLLAREMNHRVKNLFSVVAAIISRSGRDARSIEDAISRARSRVTALARAHEITQGQRIFERSPLAQMVNLILAPYLQVHQGQVIITGSEDIFIPQEFITPFGLILNEWATNAVKYGALHESGAGTVTLSWKEEEIEPGKNGLVVDWIETGGPKVMTIPDHAGFGSRLTRQAAERQMGGTLDVSWPEDGFCARLIVPLEPPEILVG